MTLGNGRQPIAPTNRESTIAFGAIALGRLRGRTLPTFQLESALWLASGAPVLLPFTAFGLLSWDSILIQECFSRFAVG